MIKSLNNKINQFCVFFFFLFCSVFFLICVVIIVVIHDDIIMTSLRTPPGGLWRGFVRELVGEGRASPGRQSCDLIGRSRPVVKGLTVARSVRV